MSGIALSAILAAYANNLLNDPSLLDPVSKIRVSEPQSLIDTDFEYGTQSTKWESLVTVNDQPIFFIRPATTNMNVTGIVTSSATNELILTAPSHGLVPGTPLAIQGTSTGVYDGTSVVRRVIDVNTITFTPPSTVVATTGEDVFSSTIVVNNGYYYTGSKIPITSLQTDALSNIILTTTSNSYIQANGKHSVSITGGILRKQRFQQLDASNTVPLKPVSNILMPNQTAGAEIPYASVAPSSTGSNLFPSNTYLANPLVPYNWFSTNVFFMPASANNTTLNLFNVTGHPFGSSNVVFMQYPQSANTHVGTVPSFPVSNLANIFFVNVVSTSSFYLTTSPVYTNDAAKTPNVVSVSTSGGSNVVNQPIIMMSNLLEISGISIGTAGSGLANALNLRTASPITFSANQPIVFGCALNNVAQVSGLKLVTNNLVNSAIYYINTTHSTTTSLYISNTINGPATNGYTYNNTFPLIAGSFANLFAIPAVIPPETNSFFLPNHGIVGNSLVIVSNSILQGSVINVATPVGAIASGFPFLVNADCYVANAISNNRITLNTANIGGALTQVDLISSNTNSIYNFTILNNVPGASGYIPYSNVSFGEFQTQTKTQFDSYKTAAILPYNWLASNVLYVANTDISLTTATPLSNVITLAGHPFFTDRANNYMTMVVCPPSTTVPTGTGGVANSFTFGSSNLCNIFYVNALSTSQFYLQASRSLGITNGTSNILITSNGNTTTQNFMFFSNISEVINISPTGQFLVASNLIPNLSYDGMPIAFAGVFMNTSAASNLTLISNNLVNVSNNYYMRFPTVNTFFVSNTVNGNLLNPIPVLGSASNLVVIPLSTSFVEYNSFYLQNHGFDNTTVLYYPKNDTTLFQTGGQGVFTANIINAGRFRLLQNNIVTDIWGQGTGNTYISYINKGTVGQRLHPTTLTMNNHGYYQNDILKFNSNGSSNISGIANNSAYFVKIIDSNVIRLGTIINDISVPSFSKLPLSNIQIPISNLLLGPIGTNVSITGDSNLIGSWYISDANTFPYINISPSIQNYIESNIITAQLNVTTTNTFITAVTGFYSNTCTDNIEFINHQTISGKFLVSNVIGNTYIINTFPTTYTTPQIIRFDPVNGNGWKAGGGFLNIPYHSLVDGTLLTYVTTGAALPGLVNGGTYYTVVKDRNTIQLASNTTPIGSIRSNTLSLVTNLTTTGTHYFTTNVLTATIVATTNIYSFSITNNAPTTSNTLLVSSAASKFTSLHQTGDQLYIESTQSKINVLSVVSDTLLYTDYDIPAINTGYLYQTFAVPVSDGYFYHRSFDGGVQLSAGMVPNQGVMRRTHTQFRYQSGKGVQMSTGTTFNSPMDVVSLKTNSPTTNNLVTVITARPHGFINNTFSQVRLFKANVISGNNYFTNAYLNVSSNTTNMTISSIPDANSFTYKWSYVQFQGSVPLAPQLGTLPTYGSVTFANILCTNQSVFTNSNLFIGMNVYTVGQGLITSTAFISNIFPNASNVQVICPGSSGTIGAGTTFEAYPQMTQPQANGFAKYGVVTLANTIVRAGLFDSTNGMFFEYSNSILYCVQRNSINQLGGIWSVVKGSPIITGQGTTTATVQLSVGDAVVIRGMVYTVYSIQSDATFTITIPYRGVTTKAIIISKVVDLKYPQSSWTIDKMDGTGPSGYNLDVFKMQMCYIDFAWYGAGKIRFGVKNVQGKVYYFHEIIHNNIDTEAYMRSGNLPATYSIHNSGTPSCLAYLNHWGTSVIMDGKFDEDKTYFFTGDSDVITLTNGNKGTFLASWTKGSTILSNISSSNTNLLKPGTFLATSSYIQNTTGSTVYTLNTCFQNATKIVSVGIDSVNTLTGAPAYIAYTNKPMLLSSNIINIGYVTAVANTNLGVVSLFQQSPIFTYTPIPLLSIRLAPSVDTGISGVLGAREIINRMQIIAKSVDITCTHESIVTLYLNADVSGLNWQALPPPSLAQTVKHQLGDVLSGGTSIYSFRATGGSVGTASSNIARNIDTTRIDLQLLAVISNSIFGGDGTFPNGPDILTITVTPVDTTNIQANAPYISACRLSWTEAQA